MQRRRKSSAGEPSIWRDLVGAWRFELQTSCAQGRRTTQNNPLALSVSTETKQLSHGRSMWLAVRECAHLSAGWAQKLAHSGGRPSRSKATALIGAWRIFSGPSWRAQRGWSIEDIASKLLEASAKAQERARLRDEGYALTTAQNAAAVATRGRQTGRG